MAGPVIGMKVVGTQLVMQKFLRVGAAAIVGLQAITWNGAQHVQAIAKRLVPVGETGNLQRGILIEKQGINDWAITASSKDGGSDREYAAHVEYGTYKMTPRPYLVPALNQAGYEIRNELAALAIRLESL